MRILQIDKFFYNRGGSSRVFFETISGLRERGHDVAEFSMLDEKNYPSGFSDYFAPHLPELKGKMAIGEKINVFRHLFYSRDVESRLEKLAAFFKPDVAHIHNAYHQLSASTFLTLRKLGIPTVLTLHDFFPLCPNHNLLVGEHLEEKKLAGRPLVCLVKKCVGGKFFPSLAGTLEAYYYQKEKIWDSIETFICPSVFMAKKMIENNFPAEKMRVIKNPFALTETYPPLGKSVVYIGRLDAEKGVKILLRAARLLPEYPIYVAGRGPDFDWAKEYIQEHDLRNVHLVGWVEGEYWRNLIGSAKVVVVPSVFLENCSLSILEGLSLGRIVVATDRGGNPELVKDGFTGFLAKPEDPDDLAKAIKKAMQLPVDMAEEIIEEGRKLVERNHNPTNYFLELEEVYRSAQKDAHVFL